MLSAGDSHKPVEVFNEEECDWIRLTHPASTVLHQPYNRFRLGLLEFALIYPRVQHDRSNSDYRDLLQARNDYMKTHLRVPIPHPEIPLVPQRDTHIRNGLRIFRTVGAGGFGWVSAAIDTVTGDPFAVKETVIKHRDQINEIRAEFDIGSCIPANSLGLVRSTSMFCEHEHPGPCGQKPEMVWIVSDLARMDFGSFPTHFTRLPKLARLNLLKQLLAGLDTLHALGIMHRDISERNCLILSAEPASAGLCDFGKAVRAATSTEAALGPRYTLAPEVDGKTEYDNKIDVWALGLVFFRMTVPGQAVARLDENGHRLAMQAIARKRQRVPNESGLFDLITDMLAWDAKDRPTSALALARIKALELADGVPAPVHATEQAQERAPPVQERAPKKLKTEESILREQKAGECELHAAQGQVVKEDSVAAVGTTLLAKPAEGQAVQREGDVGSTQPFTHEIVPRLYQPDI